MRWLPFAWIIIICPFAAQGQDSPLKVERFLWGFDGKPAIEAFNPLTLEVSNVSEIPYQGIIQLERRLGNALSGIPEMQSISLAPGGTRVVQFTPYIEQHQYIDWRVTWAGGRFNLEENRSRDSRVQASRIVELKSQHWLQQKSQTPFPSFPEHYFPTNASATTGLHTVILSHRPNWEAARAESFLRWLKRGGTLHLFPGPDGKPIRFDGSLAPLNAGRDAGQLGNGTVIQHTARLSDLQPTSVDALASPPPTQTPSNDDRQATWRAFGQSTLPDVPWAWVYVAAFVYLALIGPGHYLYARGKKRDYRKTILVLLGFVGAFAWLFGMIGRRGYENSNRWMSAGLAYSIGDGIYDVEQWAHAFVTKGDSYEFRMPESNALFSVQHQRDRIPGFLRSGPQSYLQLDLPLNSSRNLLSRAILSGPKINVDVVSWETSRNDLNVKVSSDVDIFEIWYRQDDEFFNMRQEDGMWSAGRRDKEIMEADRQYFSREPKRDLREMKLEVQKWLANRLSNVQEQSSHAREHGEILVWGEIPDEFRPTSPSFDSYQGYVFYVIPISKLPSP